MIGMGLNSAQPWLKAKKQRKKKRRKTKKKQNEKKETKTKRENARQQNDQVKPARPSVDGIGPSDSAHRLSFKNWVVPRRTANVLAVGHCGAITCPSFVFNDAIHGLLSLEDHSFL
jgi:hypothetical protein